MSRKIASMACVIGILLSLAITFSACDSSEAADSVGITDAHINENGELVLVYDNGTEQNLGTVVGRDGVDGQNGLDGKDGKDGRDGVDGADGANGADGQNGQDGKNGQDGQDGIGNSGETVIINNTGSGISAASAKGLRSAVSIVCQFQATVQQGGWRPGSGSASTQEYSSAGSGVIYQLDKAEGDAFILTNYHVVYDSGSNTANGISQDINVYLYGSEIEEKAITATYVGGSLYYDIAVLRVENSDILRASDACAVTVADSDSVAVGESAIAVGNAQGYGISTSFGIVSVDSEYIIMTAADGKTSVSFRVIRVDTAVNSGNSGGGLYDDEGNLIGIVNAKIVDDGVENIGYAIPSNVAVSVANNIIDYCFGTALERVQRALLGITVSSSNSKAVYDSATGLVSIQETVSVYEISDGSLAGGVLQAGDILVSATINDHTSVISRQYHIIDMMLDVRVGDVVTLQILRNGEEMTVSFTITEGCLTEY